MTRIHTTVISQKEVDARQSLVRLLFPFTRKQRNRIIGLAIHDLNEQDRTRMQATKPETFHKNPTPLPETIQNTPPSDTPRRGLLPETIVNRATANLNNKNLAERTSIEDTSIQTLYEIAALRAALQCFDGISFSGRANVETSRMNAYILAVRDACGYSESVQANPIVEFSKAFSQLVKDGRLVKEGEKYKVGHDAANWFEQWRARWKAAPHFETSEFPELATFCKVVKWNRLCVKRVDKFLETNSICIPKSWIDWKPDWNAAINETTRLKDLAKTFHAHAFALRSGARRDEIQIKKDVADFAKNRQFPEAAEFGRIMSGTVQSTVGTYLELCSTFARLCKVERMTIWQRIGELYRQL